MKWWLRAAIIGGVVVLVLAGVWLWLPEIAVFGLRSDVTRGTSERTLRWLGPRALRHFMSSEDCRRNLKWELAIRAVCRAADEDEHSRRTLLASLRDVDAQDPYGELLHWAVRGGFRSLADALVKNGADVNAKDDERRTPLHYAARWGHRETADLLISNGADVNAEALNHLTPLHVAALESYCDIVRLLISHGANVDAEARNGLTALHLVVEHRQLDVAGVLISHGADVNAKDDIGRTPLHWAAMLDHRAIAELLVANGADVNAKNDSGVTVLHVASWESHRDVAELLVLNGADVNSQDQDGRRALDYAWGKSRKEVADLLRRHGAKTGKELEEEKAGEAGAAVRRLQGNRASHYVAWNQASLIEWASKYLLKGFQPDPMLTERLALLAEVRALLHQLHSYDLGTPPHRTDGYRDFQDAEWPLMALCYTGYALCNFAEAWAGSREWLEEETAWILRAVTTPAISGFMKDHFGEPFPPHGEIAHSAVFLHGHWLYLAVRYKEVFGDEDFDALARKVAKALARDFGKHSVLASYRGMHYLSDNCPALAALRRYDASFGESLSKEPVQRFLSAVRQHYLDEATGLMSSYVDPTDARAPEGPRGIAVMYALTFLPEIDGELAEEQWTGARRHLVREVPWVVKRLAAGLPFAEQVAEYGEGMWVCLERPDPKGLTDNQRNLADGDSGPVLFGVGTSASAFLIAAARMNAQEDLARGTEALAIIAGNPQWVEDRLYYTHMFHPVGQAIVLFGKSLRFVSTRDGGKTPAAGSGQAAMELEPSSHTHRHQGYGGQGATPDKGETAGGGQ